MYTTIWKGKAMRHTALDTACENAYEGDELQTMFARVGNVHPVSKPVRRKMNWSLLANSIARWWQQTKRGSAMPVTAARGNEFVSKTDSKTWDPRRAVPPLMPRCPAGRRAPTEPAQQTLFAVLDQMGARHRAVGGGGTLIRALEEANQNRS